MNTLNRFPELTHEFSVFANDSESKPLRVFVCQNRRYFPSKKFGSICGCKFISNPKFVSVKCPNGCGMRLDPVPVNPTCPDCRSTNVKWVDDSGVDESEVYDTTMTTKQSQVVQNSIDEDPFSREIVSDLGNATLEPKHYGEGYEVYDKKTLDDEDVETISTRVRSRIAGYLGIKDGLYNMYQYNTAKKHFGVTPSPKLTFLNVEQIMKNMFYYSKKLDECVEMIGKSGMSDGQLRRLREEYQESYDMLLSRLKTGNMNAGYVKPEGRTMGERRSFEHSNTFMEECIVPEQKDFPQ